MESGFVFVYELNNVGFAYKQSAQNMVVNFQCRDHPDPIAPNFSWSSHDIDLLDLNFGIF